MLTFPRAFVVSSGTALRHGELHRCDLLIQLFLRRVVPWQLVEVVAAVPEKCVRRCAASGHLNQACVGEGLQPM
jgi:hypothetical protein